MKAEKTVKPVGFEIYGASAMVALPRRTTGRSRMTRRRFAVFEIKEILELAIRLEKNGEATYRKAMASCSDESMNALLQWMADEEVSHREWFAALKSDLDSGVKNPFIEEMSRQVFKDLVGGQSFSLKEVDFSKVGSTHELISIFIEFEQDTVLFYELIAPFIEDEETRGHLQRVIAEENRHIDRLREFKEAGVAAR
jgi:rubrerythrin